MINEIIKHIKDSWEEFGFNYPFPKKMNILLQSRNRIILLLFDPTIRHYPQAIVKLNRPNNEKSYSEDYVTHSQKIREMLDGAMKNTIPRMKAFQLQGSITGVIEKGIPGYPINVNTKITEYEYHQFAEWLVDFNSYCSVNKTKISPGFIETQLERISSEYHFRDELVSKIRDILYPLIGIQASTGWLVGDTHPSNILIYKKAVSGVLDWEGVSENNLSIYDWYQFIFSVIIESVKATSRSLTHAEMMRMGSNLLFSQSNSKLAEILDRKTNYYLNSQGLNPELKFNWFILFLVDYYWIKNKQDFLHDLLPGIL
jgi:hypothetical protein